MSSRVWVPGFPSLWRKQGWGNSPFPQWSRTGGLAVLIGATVLGCGQSRKSLTAEPSSMATSGVDASSTGVASPDAGTENGTPTTETTPVQSGSSSPRPRSSDSETSLATTRLDEAGVAPETDASAGTSETTPPDRSSRHSGVETSSPNQASDAGAVTSGAEAGVTTPYVVASGLTDIGQFEQVACTISPLASVAAAIPTVGIATFQTDLVDAGRAVIQFGSDGEYALEAPVQWDASEHRTLLLGMPADTTVHYRVLVFRGEQVCVGEDASYETEALPDTAPVSLTPIRGPSEVPPAPGFIIAERGAWAYIVNKRGAVVWAHQFPINLTRALMSWDGRYMLARDVGPFDADSGGAIYRVAMDGTGEMRLDLAGGTHHDFTVIPGGIAYPAKAVQGECDSLYTASIDGGDAQVLVDLDVVFGKFALGPQAFSHERCHVNAVRYYADTESYSLSDREKDAIAFISKTGEVLGSVGAQPIEGTPNHILAEGADSTSASVWRVQHGHDHYAPNKLVLWSNGIFLGGKSKLLHYTIEGGTATLDWQYTGTGNSPTFSDAQHLPNGNFLATNSGNGTVHEIDPERQLVLSFAGLSRGYTCHRPTLYGPPPGR